MEVDQITEALVETLKEVEAAWVDSLIFSFLDFPRFNPDGSLSL